MFDYLQYMCTIGGVTDRLIYQLCSLLLPLILSIGGVGWLSIVEVPLEFRMANGFWQPGTDRLITLSSYIDYLYLGNCNLFVWKNSIIITLLYSALL